MSGKDQPTTYPYAEEEIIVALPHCGQVINLLDAAEVVFSRPPETSVELDLARFTFSDPSAAAAALDRFAPPDGRQQKPRPDDYATRILLALRRRLASQHQGWVATMGKNRYLSPVHGGGGAISHGGGGSPVKVPSPKWRRRADGPGRGVRVGVLDTGIALHPWLDGAWMAGQADRVPPAPQYEESVGHGTFVTGLVLEQAPGATVVCRVVPDEDPHANGATAAARAAGYSDSSWAVAKKIVSLGRDVDVLNLSFLCQTDDGQHPLVLAKAIDRLGPDVVVVAAAGNHGGPVRSPYRADESHRNGPAYPAALDDVIAVGAADRSGRALDFTPVDRYWIDLLAPGDRLVSTYLFGKVKLAGGEEKKFKGWAEWSGSSFAAAMLSGAIAAGTEPGRVTARQSFEEIRSNARVVAEKSGEFTPPFVDLRNGH